MDISVVSSETYSQVALANSWSSFHRSLRRSRNRSGEQSLEQNVCKMVKQFKRLGFGGTAGKQRGERRSTEQGEESGRK